MTCCWDSACACSRWRRSSARSLGLPAHGRAPLDLPAPTSSTGLSPPRSPAPATGRGGSPPSLPAGGWRPVRMLAIALSFAYRHLAATLACLGLWIVGGFGRGTHSERMQRAHYAVLRWFVSGVYETIARVARVEVRMLESAAGEEVLSSPPSGGRLQPPRGRGGHAARDPSAPVPARAPPACGHAPRAPPRSPDRCARRAPPEPLRGPARATRRSRSRRWQATSTNGPRS